MYVCICNAITEKMLAENSFLLSLVGSKCGKCVEDQSVSDGERVVYLNDCKRNNSGNTP